MKPDAPNPLRTIMKIANPIPSKQRNVFITEQW